MLLTLRVANVALLLSLIAGCATAPRPALDPEPPPAATVPADARAPAVPDVSSSAADAARAADPSVASTPDAVAVPTVPMLSPPERKGEAVPAPSPVPPAPRTPATMPPPAAAAQPAAGKPATAPPAPVPAAKSAPVVAKPAPEVADTSAPAVESGSVSGRIELVAGGRQSVTAGEVADGVVYFLPKAGAARPKPGRFTIDTQSKGFAPSLLVVPLGSSVRFPNTDMILHNVFSRTPGAEFDLGTYGKGETRQHVFNKAGLVLVNCNVHANMRATVLVLATPHYVRPGKDGRFMLKDLPPGAGTLVFWHPRATAAQSLALSSAPTAPVLRRLTADKPRLDAHEHGNR